MLGEGWALALGDPAPDARSAQVIAVHAIEALGASDARALLAALRDRVAQSVLVLVDHDRAPLDPAALRALGFRVLARAGAQTLYGFDLYDYKERPDWLDARHWAHPELWDRFRW